MSSLNYHITFVYKLFCEIAVQVFMETNDKLILIDMKLMRKTIRYYKPGVNGILR